MPFTAWRRDQRLNLRRHRCRLRNLRLCRSERATPVIIRGGDSTGRTLRRSCRKSVVFTVMQRHVSWRVAVIILSSSYDRGSPAVLWSLVVITVQQDCTLASPPPADSPVHQPSGVGHPRSACLSPKYWSTWNLNGDIGHIAIPDVREMSCRKTELIEFKRWRKFDGCAF